MRQTINKLESERRMLKEDLGKYENRATQMEVHRMSLEGDLQRLQMIIQEKEGTILVTRLVQQPFAKSKLRYNDGHFVELQKLQERCDTQTRSITSLEERCSSLKSTIEQMNHSLEKAASTESEMKSEMNHMHRTIIELNAHSQSDAEKIKQVGVYSSGTQVRCQPILNVTAPEAVDEHGQRAQGDGRATGESPVEPERAAPREPDPRGPEHAASERVGQQRGSPLRSGVPAAAVQLALGDHKDVLRRQPRGGGAHETAPEHEAREIRAQGQDGHFERQGIVGFFKIFF